MNTQTIDRYPGPRSFYDNASDRLLFHGREEEIDLLYHRVCASRLLVLFGKSGAGKTSLLQAGIFEKLRQEQHRLPILVRFNIPATPLETVQAAISEICQKFGMDYTPGEGETLWEFFKTVMLWQDDVLLTPVLVLDQFEEIFTLRSAQERSELARELGDLFRATLPPRVRHKRQLRDTADTNDIALTASLSEQPPNVHVIISLREDFVGALQELATEIPGIFDDRVRLSPLSDTQAEQAIRKPAACQPTEATQFTTPPFSYTDDALTEIIRYLRGKSGVIEPFQLQLVCRDIEQKVAQQSAQDQPIACITREVLGGEVRLNAIVKNFYLQTLSKLPQYDRKSAKRLCEEGLLNAEGFRLPLQENEIFKQYRLDSQALVPLVEARLLRKESRLESNFYELSHDSLTRPIFESRPLKLTRKQRVIARIVVYSGLAALFMVSVFGFFQWEQKEQANIANQQAQEAREAAESVLDFLVFDLRDKLVPLGRLDIIEMIQQRVSDYYEKMGIEGQSTKVLNRLVASYDSEGDRLFEQGMLEEAEKAYQRSLSLIKYAALLEPHKHLWQRNVSVSLIKIADVLNAQGKPQDALKNYQESLAIRQKLVAHDPSSTSWQRDVSVALEKIADVLNAQGKQQGALKNYQESLAIRQKLVTHDPSSTDWQRDVSVSLVKIGGALIAQGKLEDALKHYQESLVILQKLVAHDPSNTGWQRNVSVALEKIADALNAQGKPEDALKHYQESLAIRQKLAIHDPSNTGWQRDVSIALEKIAGALNAQGKPEDALKNYQESLTIRQKLIAHDPSNTGWQRDVSIALDKIAGALNAQGKPEDALKNYQESLTIRQKLVAHDPSNTIWQRDASLSLIRIGNVLSAQGKPENALRNYQESLAIMQKLVAHDPNNAGWQNDLAAAYLGVAWYQLLNQQPERAIETSERGLAIKTDERMEATLHTNLAHGYLFTSQFDKAQAIYLRYQDKIIIDGRSFKQSVLDDFKEFRQRDIHHVDMGRIEVLLQ